MCVRNNLTFDVKEGKTWEPEEPKHMSKDRLRWNSIGLMILFGSLSALTFVFPLPHRDTDYTTSGRSGAASQTDAATGAEFVPTAPTLPDLPNLPTIPCDMDPICGFINGVLIPMSPPSTRALINVPGTCQNWSREWLRTGNDIMEFQVERIRQRFALAMMYCEFNGDTWSEASLWVSQLHECDWYSHSDGDFCGRQGEYRIIRNFGLQMRGTIPPEISMISTLWEVTLSDNIITGTIPTDLERLSELEALALSFNLLSGSIPNFVWEMHNMQQLDLAYNFFTGTIPDNKLHIEEPRLRILSLENNDLSGSIPSDLAQLTHLKKLHMDGNLFTGKIPDLNYMNMEEIVLQNNMLTGTFPMGDGVDDSKAMESPLATLTLHNNNLTPGSSIEGLSKLASPSGKLQTASVDPDIECSFCTSAES